MRLNVYRIDTPSAAEALETLLVPTATTNTNISVTNDLSMPIAKMACISQPTNQSSNKLLQKIFDNPHILLHRFMSRFAAVDGAAQWFGRWSLAGGLSPTSNRSMVDWRPLCG